MGKALSKAKDLVLSLRMLGAEPDWTPGIELQEDEKRRAYHWYRYTHGDSDQAKKWTLQFLRSKGTGSNILKKLAKLHDLRFEPVGWQARMIERNAKLPPSSLDWMKTRLRELVAESSAFDISDEVSDEPKISVQDRMRDQVGDFIAEMDDLIDEASANKFKFPEGFNPEAWLIQERCAKAPHARMFASHYQPLLDELNEVLKGKDPDLLEGYRFYKKADLVRFRDFLSSIVSEAQKVRIQAVVQRKPRKKKVIPVSKIVGKLKYLKSEPNLKATSIPPENVLGAQNLWVYNVVKRKLALYVAESEVGLSIKGTTIYGFSEEKSIQKNVKKPEEVIPRLLVAGKVELRKFMDSIKAIPQVVRGRISEEVLLLKSSR